MRVQRASAEHARAQQLLVAANHTRAEAGFSELFRGEATGHDRVRLRPVHLAPRAMREGPSVPCWRIAGGDRLHEV